MNRIYFFLFWSLAVIAKAQNAGGLDLTFGDHGFSTVDHRSFESIHAIALRQDAKIMAAGFTEEDERSKIAVLRYLSNGTVDESFGNAGLFIGEVSNLANVATSIAIQSDGKTLVGGYYMAESSSFFKEDLFVLRLSEEGVPDGAFGNNGWITLDLGKNERAVALQIDAENKICVACNSFNKSQSAMFLLRFLPNGMPDASFGTNGRMDLPVSSSIWNCCYDMVLQPDGKILVAGESITAGSGANFTLMRIEPQGAFDLTFNGDGKTTNSLGLHDDVPVVLEVLPDGNILAAGYSVDNNGLSNLAIVRYSATGDFDNSFGVTGKVIIPVQGHNASIADLKVTPNGDILAIGSAENECNSFDLLLAKLDNVGNLYADFGELGFLYSDFGENADGISDALMLPDGKILVGGMGVNTDNTISEFLLARYYLGNGVGVPKLPNEISNIQLFPNPVTENQFFLQFHIVNTSDVDIELFSVGGISIGNLWHSQNATGPQNVNVALPEGAPSGCYLVGIRTNSGRVFTKVIVSKK